MYKKYKVMLTPEERESLSRLISIGKAAAQKILHARILLKADEGPSGPAWTDQQMVAALEVSSRTIERVRQRSVEEGLAAALQRKKQIRPPHKKWDGEKEAHLIALACSAPPQGRTRWTMQLLADKMVELCLFESISDEAIRTTLKKMNSNPG